MFNTTVLLLAFITFLSTLTGGAVAVKKRNALPYFFAFAAGALVAVAFLDLLPESLQVAQSIGLPFRDVFIAVVLSFLGYSLLERYLLTHHHHGDGGEGHEHVMGQIGAASLCIHSLLDGVAIGTAYQVNPAIGIIVALAVIFHDFTDGINTVTVMFRRKNPVRLTVIFLIADAVAPVIGVLFTYLISIGPLYLSLLIGIFVGEFLYIGASSLLPETYKHTPWKMMATMSFGIFLIMFLTSLI